MSSAKYYRIRNEDDGFAVIIGLQYEVERRLGATMIVTIYLSTSYRI